jgi:hypothetical protein
MVNETIKTYNICPDCIVSLDETNSYFDQVKKIGYQLCDRCAKEVNLQTAGNSSRCTIGVGVMGTSDMLTHEHQYLYHVRIPTVSRSKMDLITLVH